MKIFYLMHIPWGWAKQRPHFLAEQLSQEFGLDVFLPRIYRVKSLVKNGTTLHRKEFFRLPFERFKIVRIINKFIVRFILKYIYQINSYEYVWLTDLRLFPYVKSILQTNQKLIFDCMDDVLDFDILKNQYSELKSIEEELFQKVDLIFFSSDELKTRKIKMYNINQSKYEVIFNAFDCSLLNQPIFNRYDFIFEKQKNLGYKTLTYIGTISSWFDFEIIKKSLDDFDDIVYILVGPIEPHIEVLKHDRIIYIGAVEHKYVKSLILKSDGMIMPFKVNKLVTAVDPVKLYEYIALGKNIISVEYNELNKFKEFVKFYNDYNGFKSMLDFCIKNPNNNSSLNIFIENNHWGTRVKQIIIKIHAHE